MRATSRLLRNRASLIVGPKPKNAVGWSYFRMDDFLSDKGKSSKAKIEAVMKEMMPVVCVLWL